MTYANIAIGPCTVKRGGLNKDYPFEFKVVLRDGMIVTVQLTKAERNRLLDELRDSQERGR